MFSLASKIQSVNRAVANATGETVSEIRRRGFSIVDIRIEPTQMEPIKTTPSHIDWDEFEQHSEYRSGVVCFDFERISGFKEGDLYWEQGKN